MPIYEFACPEHGTFEEMRSFSACGDPAACPACGAAAERIVSVPHLALMDGATRRAHAGNERSRHAPEVHRGALHEHGRFHVHRNGCCGTGRAKAGNPLLSYQGPRPWVMEHGQGSTVSS